MLSSDSLKYFYEPSANSIDRSMSSCGQYQTITNADTLVGDKNYKIERDQNTIRILTLGDSFTHGICLAAHENWPSLLEAELNNKIQINKKRYEVLNLGFDGYDTAYSAMRFNVRGAKYTPDIIVWLVLENDFSENNEELLKRYYSINTKKQFDSEKYIESLMFVRKKYISDKKKFIKNNIAYFLSTARQVREKPIYIFTYNIVDTDIINELKALSSQSQNIFFIKNIPQLNSDEVLMDGHPNQDGHTKIMKIITRSVSFEKKIF